MLRRDGEKGRATDPDGDAVRFSAENLPPFARLRDNGDGSATIEVHAQAADAGSHLVTLIATDVDEDPQATRLELPLRVRSKALVRSCGFLVDCGQSASQAV